MVTNVREGRIALACLTCRSKHLRCDGQQPICSRCAKKLLKCSYLPSRRGVRPGRQRVTSETPLHDQRFDNETSVEEVDDGDRDLEALDAYYAKFHAAHPFALPQAQLRREGWSEQGSSLARLAMCYIGAHYSSSSSIHNLEMRLRERLHEYTHLVDPWHVSALLLLAVGRYWDGNKDEGCLVLQRAARMAIDLGMHREEFAAAQSNAILAESWRRLFWELYITDFQVAAINRLDKFPTSCKVIEITTALPCEDFDYELGIIPPSRTVTEYDDRELIDDVVGFSSYAHLIGLVRSLDCSVLVNDNDIFSRKATCTNVDSVIKGWSSCLAPSGQTSWLNVALFKAYTLVYISQIETHRVLSTLQYMPCESVSTCSPLPPPHILPKELVEYAAGHTDKVLLACEKLTELLLQRPDDVTLHSPYTVCILASATIVQAAACKQVLSGLAKVAARERIRASISMISSFAKVWPQAKVVLNQVKYIVATALRSDENMAKTRLPDEAGLVLDDGNFAASGSWHHDQFDLQWQTMPHMSGDDVDLFLTTI